MLNKMVFDFWVIWLCCCCKMIPPSTQRPNTSSPMFFYVLGSCGQWPLGFCQGCFFVLLHD
jgi:hypothetical protein